MSAMLMWHIPSRLGVQEQSQRSTIAVSDVGETSITVLYLFCGAVIEKDGTLVQRQVVESLLLDLGLET